MELPYLIDYQTDRKANCCIHSFNRIQKGKQIAIPTYTICKTSPSFQQLMSQQKSLTRISTNPIRLVQTIVVTTLFVTTNISKIIMESHTHTRGNVIRLSSNHNFYPFTKPNHPFTKKRLTRKPNRMQVCHRFQQQLNLKQHKYEKHNYHHRTTNRSI